MRDMVPISPPQAGIFSRFSRSAKRSFREEPFPVAVQNIVSKIFRSLVSVWQSRIYNAPGLHLGSGALVKGARYIRFGKNVYIHSGLWLEAVSEYRGQVFSPSIEIGDNVCMSHGVHLSCIEKVTLKSGILIGSHVHISDHGHGKYRGNAPSFPSQPPAERVLAGGPVLIEENVWIGDNVVILGPVRIGSGAIIGANSVVKGDIPADTIAAGGPARALRTFDSNRLEWDRT